MTVSCAEADALFALTRPTDLRFDFRSSTGTAFVAADFLPDSSLSLGYGTHSGAHALRARIASSYGIRPDCVLIVPGATFGLFLAASTFLGGSGKALIARPSYPSAFAALKWSGARMEEFVTAFDARYSLPQASMLARVTGDVQLVSIATPQNPSGIVIPGPALAGLVDGIALRAPDAIVLVDETFREASESPEPSAIALGDRVVVLGSLSKAYGTAGLRLGWIASQSRRWIEQLERAKAELFHSVSVVDEAMAVEVLDRSEDVLKAQRAEIATGLRLVENWVSANGNMVEWLRPDAGAMCVIRPRLAGSQEAKLFEQALIRNGIALASGELFGDSRGIYRLGFGGKPAGVLEGGLEALGECLAAVR